MSSDESASATGPVTGPPASPTSPALPPTGEVSDPDAGAIPAGPPWSLDVLADLHAGRYPTELAGPLRTRIATDPQAASVLAALDATVDELSLLPTPRMPERFALRLDAAIANEHLSAGTAVPGAAAPGSAVEGVPQPRQGVDQSVSATHLQQAVGGRPRPLLGPPSTSEPVTRPFPQSGPPSPRPLPRISAPPTEPPMGRHPGREQRPVPPAAGPPATSRPALVPPATFAGVSGAPGSPVGGDHGAPVRSLDAARARRRRWIGGLAAAAAVAVIGTVAVASLDHSGGTGNVAAPAPAAGASSGANALQLDPGRIGDALKQIEGQRPVGPLQNATTYARCLTANSIDPSAVSGVTAATFQGRPAAAIAVVIDAGHSRVVVVGPSCGIDGAADQLAAQTVTR